jgi:hypothetical protein
MTIVKAPINCIDVQAYDPDGRDLSTGAWFLIPSSQAFFQPITFQCASPICPKRSSGFLYNTASIIEFFYSLSCNSLEKEYKKNRKIYAAETSFLVETPLSLQDPGHNELYGKVEDPEGRQ